MSSGTSRSGDAKQSGSPNKNQLTRDANDIKEDLQTLVEDVGNSIQSYCKKRPQMAGLMIFAVGFYVGWKVKPW